MSSTRLCSWLLRLERQRFISGHRVGSRFHFSQGLVGPSPFASTQRFVSSGEARAVERARKNDEAREALQDPVHDFETAESKVEGYFSRLYGRGGIPSQREKGRPAEVEDVHDEGGAQADDADDISDDDIMHLPGFHRGMTPDRKARFLEKRRLLSQTGRLWSDPFDIDDTRPEMHWDDIPDWTPSVVSQAAKDLLHVEDRILTLEEISGLKLPLPRSPLPSTAPKEYVRYRKEAAYNEVYDQVKELARERVHHLLKLDDPRAQQDGIDELYELIEEEVRAAQGPLRVNRRGPKDYSTVPAARLEETVERALRRYLNEVNARVREGGATSNAVVDDTANLKADRDGIRPVFMDIRKVSGELFESQDHLFAGTGLPDKLKDSFECMATRDSSNRIMLRQCIQEVAQAMRAADARSEAAQVFIQGEKGVGKSTVLTAIVASARESGSIVLFLLHGNRLRRYGYYVEPSDAQPGLYDTPVLAQQQCSQLLEAHGKQLDDLFGNEQTPQELLPLLNQSVYNPKKDDPIPSVMDCLRKGAESEKAASGCFQVIVRALSDQTEVPFVVAMDEYNCYYDTTNRYYYHMDYDPTVEEAIPLHLMTLFRSFLTLGPSEDAPPVKLMKRGAMIGSITHTRAVPGKDTSALQRRVARQADVKVVTVPRYSKLELRHIVANLEATGFGRLRFNEGKVLSDPQELEYIRLVTGGVGSMVDDEAILFA